MLRKAVATLKKTGPLVEKSASAMPRVQVLLINKRILIHNRKRARLPGEKCGVYLQAGTKTHLCVYSGSHEKPKTDGLKTIP